MSNKTKPSVIKDQNYIRFYSHSLIFYFWPLWLISIILGTIGSFTTIKDTYTGTAFIFFLLFTIFSTTVSIRGLWVILISLAFMVIALVLNQVGVLSNLFNTISSLHVSLDSNFYFLFGVPLATMWLFIIVLYDRRKYIELRPHELSVIEEIGEGVKNYDTMGLAFRKERDNFVQHWIFGLGSGDLIITASIGGHKETIYVANIISISKKIEAMHHILEKRGQ
jgi:energy-coupling factor transporter transmembrane protein EcfT